MPAINMRSIAILTTIFSNLALAGPVKRAVVTEWDVVTVTVFTTETATAAATQTHSNPPPAISSSVTSVVGTVSAAGAAVTTATPLVVSTSSAAASNQAGLSDYASKVLEQHNIHRDNHSVPALTWDNDLADIAKEIANTCIYAHSNKFGDGKYGQNIGAGAPESDIPKMITDIMYNGEITSYPGYDVEPDMSNFEAWGHFSQIVWKGTQRVGCYTATCKTLANVSKDVRPYFTVCNFRPQGNMIGSFVANVLKPLGEPSVIL